MSTITKTFSMDAETDGLWGKAFSIGAVVMDGNKEVDRFYACLPLSKVKDPWVIENVLPTLDKNPTHETYEAMLADFAAFYKKYKDEYTTMYHMGHIVESFLFREMHTLGYIGDWDAPYTPIEVSDILRTKGFAADSVDNYAKEHSIELPNMATHNPLYDSIVTSKVYNNLMSI